jgi:type I restriction-modification system DNA methylase subunit
MSTNQTYIINKNISNKRYYCNICKNKPDQISHHKEHLTTQKHKDKTEILKLKLLNLPSTDLLHLYKTDVIENIISLHETVIFSNKEKIIDYKNNDNNDLKFLTLENNFMGQNLPFNNTIDILQLMDNSNNISNKEALKDKIHEIHNYLRNNGVGYGMNALKVFNILYGLKKIEEANLLEQSGLVNQYSRFSNLLVLANNYEDEKLTDVILNDVLDDINDSHLKNLLFYEIPKNIKSSVFGFLIKEINSITHIEKTCNVLLSGKIYEYFIGRDETAISELGAYFTDRHIVEFILAELNPCLNKDGSVPTMIDMFGGSGGFSTGYIDYLIKHNQNINWHTELHKIFHYDINNDVIKSAGLEFFCLTGVIPKVFNMTYKNAFNDEFRNQDDYMRFKYVLTNPPYGGDKNKKNGAQAKRKKIMNFIKSNMKTSLDNEIKRNRENQLRKLELEEKQFKEDLDKSKINIKMCSNRLNIFARKYKLLDDKGKCKGNDKEACSLMLLMDLVDVNGTGMGVLKEGVFFDKKYAYLRKCLIENYNVREIISVPQDQFENTSTKTTILIFDNTENKTSNIRFSELEVRKYTSDRFVEIEGNIYLGQNEGDIYDVVKKVISVASREEVMKNEIYSLNGKDYNKKELVVGEGYKLVKLGDICEFLKKSKRQASFGKEDGEYNFYTSSNKIQKCDVADYKEECVLIGTGGNSCLHYNNTNFSCSTDMLLLNGKLINNKYIYYSIAGLWKCLTDKMHGTTIKHVTKDMINKFEIPIPKDEERIRYWVERITQPYEEKNEKEKRVKELENMVKNRIREIGENEECDEVELGSVCDTKSGEYITKANMKIGIYPIYGGGNISNYIDTYNRENQLLINKDGVSINCVKFEIGKFFLNHHGWTLVYKNIEYKNYINYWLFNNQLEIYNLANGSAQKGVNKEKFLKIKIKIPKNKQLIADLEPTFQEIERLQNEVRTAEELYKQYIKELAQEAIPPQFNEMIYNVENNNVNDNENDLEDEKSQDNTEQNISILNEMNTPINEVNNNEVNNNEVNCDWIMKSGKNKGQRCNKNNCKTHNKTNEEVKTSHEVVLSEEEVKTSDDDTNTPTNTRTNTPDDNRCQGITKKGERCSKKVKSGESKCNSHK